jgi:hypothetical protein
MPAEADGNSAPTLLYRPPEVTAPCASVARLSAPEYFFECFTGLMGRLVDDRARGHSLLPLPPCPNRLLILPKIIWRDP